MVAQTGCPHQFSGVTLPRTAVRHDADRSILGALQRAGVKIATTMTGQMLDLSMSSGDLLSSLATYFAAEWLRKHRERVTQGRITAVQRGRKPAGRPPWGFAYNP